MINKLIKFLNTLLSFFVISSRYASPKPDMTEARALWGIDNADAGTTVDDIKDDEIDASGNPVKKDEEPPVETPDRKEPEKVENADVKKDNDKPGDSDEEPETVYKVGDKEIPEAQYVEYFAKLTEKYGEAKIKSMSAEALEILMTEQANIFEASKGANQKSQRLAQEKRTLEADKEGLNTEKEKFINEKKQFEEQHKAKQKEIEDQVKELKARQDKYKELIKAQQTIIERDPDDETDERESIKLEVKQDSAKEKIKDLEDSISEIDKKIKATGEKKTRIQEEAELVETYYNIQELQNMFPELKTSEPVIAILDRNQIAEDAGKDFDGEPEDLLKAERIKFIVKAFYESGSKNIDRFYRTFKHNLPPLPTAQSVKSKTVKEVNADNIKSVISDILKKQKSPANPKGLGASHSTASHTNGRAKEIEQEEYRKKIGISGYGN